MVNEITIRRPDDMHVHLRSGELLELVGPATARQFSRAVVMPNLRPPVRTTHEALSYRDEIHSVMARAGHYSFVPLMTIYLTDDTDPDDIRTAKASGIVGAKLYPQGATTNSGSGVTSVGKITRVLEAMEEVDLPLLVHGEVVGEEYDVFDRELVFLDQVLDPLLERFRTLSVVLEHVTTKDGVDFVQSRCSIAATITAHHLLENRNALFRGGLQPHNFCLPVLKTERDRTALLEAATSGKSCFFAGTDSAPHERHSKEASCGCAGCYTAIRALELYAHAFDQVGKIEALEDFTSTWGARFYDLPLNEGTVTLRREPSVVPLVASSDPDGTTCRYVVPFWAGRELAWKMVE